MSDELEPGRNPDDLAERVRKIRHLDPFRIGVRPDGRFSCELDRPIEEISPDEARRIVESLEPIVERLRRRAAGEE